VWTDVISGNVGIVEPRFAWDSGVEPNKSKRRRGERLRREELDRCSMPTRLRDPQRSEQIKYIASVVPGNCPSCYMPGASLNTSQRMHSKVQGRNVWIQRAFQLVVWGRQVVLGGIRPRRQCLLTAYITLMMVDTWHVS